MTSFGRPEFEESVAAIRKQTQQQPVIGMILGSGLGKLADSVEQPDVIDYNNIPHWPMSTVKGHAHEMVIGRLEGQSVLILRGRSHFYEGYPLSQITLPVRVMKVLGIETIILTNAAGGLNRNFRSGDVMLINDHINMIGLVGNNPLIGPNDESFGPRFPDMTRVYDPALRQLAIDVAAEAGIPLMRGVYIGLSGPTFETPAEVRFLRMIGADAVGMSTVAEATVARHSGMRVLGFSGISNVVIDDPESERETTHDEVLAAGEVIVPRLEAIVRGVLRRYEAPAL
ncbi:MAG: purine-nucleoside phosphorylase [Chloroflexi bacterium]|nr:purine-nucleoside phosphorylase [Chloroflexota bacterium]